MTIYLYKKTHKDTGLKYLGKTIAKDPYAYPGSGIYWTRHLEKHGNNVETEILCECATEEELKFWGQHYSKLWNVVESKDWANLIEEAGPGGVWSRESKEKLSQTNKESLAKLTPEQKSQRMKNSCSSPSSWTESRRKKISQALTGITRSKETREKISKFQATKTNEDKMKCGDKHRGKTWKLIDGKRVWLPKENLV
jgi:hypothetical protein